MRSAITAKVERTVDAEPTTPRARRSPTLEADGIAMSDVTDKLLVDGLASFQKSFDTLLAGLARQDEDNSERSSSRARLADAVAAGRLSLGLYCATVERRSSARSGPSSASREALRSLMEAG